MGDWFSMVGDCCSQLRDGVSNSEIAVSNLEIGVSCSEIAVSNLEIGIPVQRLLFPT
jgi:hypothetical protein